MYREILVLFMTNTPPPLFIGLRFESLIFYFVQSFVFMDFS